MTAINFTNANNAKTSDIFISLNTEENKESSTAQISPQNEGNKANLLLKLDDLNKKKNDLLLMMQSIQKSLSEIESEEKSIKSQISEMGDSENPKSQTEMTTQAPSVVPSSIHSMESPNLSAEITAVTEVAYPILLINTAQIITSKDSSGDREHYSVSLIAKENEKIEIAKWPVDVKKYGEIKQITIFDGKNETALKIDTPQIKRLITYLSTDFDTFRKELNKESVDRNGSYPNKHQGFDCQRFSYYLQHGTEGTYTLRSRSRTQNNYRYDIVDHVPGLAYSIKAQTADFGKNGNYGGKDLSIHHFVCLSKDVYVSKYGSTDVLFTSYKQILDAYFPEKFITGNSYNEW